MRVNQLRVRKPAGSGRKREREREKGDGPSGGRGESREPSMDEAEVEEE